MRKLPLSVNIVHLQKEEGKEAKVRRRGKGGGRGGRREQEWGRERETDRGRYSLWKQPLREKLATVATVSYSIRTC